MRLLGFLALCAMLLSVPAHAAPQCENTVVQVQQQLAKLGDGLQQHKADPILSAAIVEKYNELPPASDVKADFVAVYYMPGYQTVFAVLETKSGCVPGTLQIPLQAFAALVREARPL